VARACRVCRCLGSVCAWHVVSVGFTSMLACRSYNTHNHNPPPTNTNAGRALEGPLCPWIATSTPILPAIPTPTTPTTTIHPPTNTLHPSPLAQAVLSEALSGRGLDRHLDSDEAVVLGASLFAANLSTSFRLRKFGMSDLSMYGIQVRCKAASRQLLGSF
jgi:hypothetical protein